MLKLIWLFPLTLCSTKGWHSLSKGPGAQRRDPRGGAVPLPRAGSERGGGFGSAGGSAAAGGASGRIKLSHLPSPRITKKS